MNFLLSLGLMALISTNDGRVVEYGSVAGWPDKTAAQSEVVISQDQFDAIHARAGQARLVGGEVVGLDQLDILPSVTIPILDTDTGEQIGTARLVANPNLDLIATTNSASPEWAKTVQLADIKAKNQRNRTNAALWLAKAGLAKTNAPAANSVPALRAEVRRLAEIIESMAQEGGR